VPSSFNQILAAAPSSDLLRDELRGDVRRARAASDGRPRLSNKLDERLGAGHRFGFRSQRLGASAFDARQRAIVKIHYFGHGGGGGGALGAHARYIAREAASRDEPAAEPALEADETARAHAAYLARADAGTPFYDALAEHVDCAARAASWARADRRHFRIILAPENGGEIGDLKPYVRDVMARAEAALGTRLDWVAVDHWDTDNPHTHIVLRGRREDGRDLVIPRPFVQHGFRNAARDAATDRLGQRTPEQARDALNRETRAHRPTQLDDLIARQIEPNGQLRIASLKSPRNYAHETEALKARARELKRLGLAAEPRRNVLILSPGWRNELANMEMHLNVRKRLVHERTSQRQSRAVRSVTRDILGR
jgi:type IV secretory pathway VirD2 relaxase